MDKDLEEIEASDHEQDINSSIDSDSDVDSDPDISDDDESVEEPSVLSSAQSESKIAVDQSLEEDDDDEYLQKFDKELTDKYIEKTHPESLINNYNEILVLSKVVRNTNNIIVDEMHKTIPILTKYEKTRIIGQRSKQLNEGSTPFIPISENILDTRIIAEMELKEKKLPFIIRRPIPNGSFEYWCVEDLELL